MPSARPLQALTTRLAGVPVWTQRATVRWRPVVSFVDGQASILRNLESADLLRSFYVGEDRVGVDIIDPTHALAFGSGGLELFALRPEPDVNAIEAAATLVWDGLQPGPIHGVVLEFQFITPVDGDYDSTRRGAGDRVWHSVDAARNVDFAILGDMANDDLDAEIRYEAGIVEAIEASDRLPRDMPGSAPMRPVTSNLFPPKSLPPVALYNWQQWRLGSPSIGNWKDMFNVLTAAREKAEVVNAAIHERLIGEE
jgi:hypothetical protein